MKKSQTILEIEEKRGITWRALEFFLEYLYCGHVPSIQDNSPGHTSKSPDAKLHNNSKEWINSDGTSLDLISLMVEVVHLMFVAKVYACELLMTLCRRYLFSSITGETWFHVIKEADILGLMEAKDVCKLWAKYHIKTIVARVRR